MSVVAMPLSLNVTTLYVLSLTKLCHLVYERTYNVKCMMTDFIRNSHINE